MLTPKSWWQEAVVERSARKELEDRCARLEYNLDGSMNNSLHSSPEAKPPRPHSSPKHTTPNRSPDQNQLKKEYRRIHEALSVERGARKTLQGELDAFVAKETGLLKRVERGLTTRAAVELCCFTIEKKWRKINAFRDWKQEVKALCRPSERARWQWEEELKAERAVSLRSQERARALEEELSKRESCLEAQITELRSSQEESESACEKLKGEFIGLLMERDSLTRANGDLEEAKENLKSDLVKGQRMRMEAEAESEVRIAQLEEALEAEKRNNKAAAEVHREVPLVEESFQKDAYVQQLLEERKVLEEFVKIDAELQQQHREESAATIKALEAQLLEARGLSNSQTCTTASAGGVRQ